MSDKFYTTQESRRGLGELLNMMSDILAKAAEDMRREAEGKPVKYAYLYKIDRGYVGPERTHANVLRALDIKAAKLMGNYSE